jgi:hypothetical protein
MNAGTYQGEYHPASPLVDFIAELTQTNYQAVLDSGFLDMLVCMYICNFSSGGDAFSLSQRLISDIAWDPWDHSAMMEACTTTLQMLCKQTDALAVVLAHPVSVLWPKNQALLFLFGHRLNERCFQWREVGSVIVARRLAVLPGLLQLPVTKKKSDFFRLVDLCVDCVEFSRQVALYGSVDTMLTRIQGNLVRFAGCPGCAGLDSQMHQAPWCILGRTQQGA